ncbi:MAG: Glu/Leu/Phe/Val dehydrogenase [Candidatus Pacearchaeota archaeon]|nr:Glu/Leu/Phe/Val dehydrogenase [Candidatus Pacearchaeota archaeon]
MELDNFADDIGPEKIIEVYDPKTGMRGFTVLDNTALGPAKGGIRMTPSVDIKEVFRLARAMTLKNALADLPFGGGKSGIIYDKKTQENKKIDFIKSFGRALKNIAPSEYVAAPDINTNEKDMETFVISNGNFNSATGKPLGFCQEVGGKKACGLPHELGSTGFGVAYSTKVALEHAKIPIKGATIAIEGFGNVGTFTFKKLEEYGAKIVAVSDSQGVLYNSDGLDFKKTMKIKEERGSVIHGDGEHLESKKIFELPVDVLIPAALPDVINNTNKDKVKAKIIVEAANIPMPIEIEEELSKKILIIPDFVANAGGVISSYVEYIGGTVEDMNKLIEEKLVKNTDHVLQTAFKKKITPREAATQIAMERIKKAMANRNYR